MQTIRRLLRRAARRAGYDVTRLQPDTILLRGEDLARALALQRVMALAATVPGDVVECGVGRGATFLALALLAEAEGRDRHLWGFDSFQGLPAPTGEDASPRHVKQGELSFGTADDIRAQLRRSVTHPAFVDTHCHLVAGFFEDTLSSFDRPIALLHLDVDLYHSYKTCLAALYPRLSPGGVMLFDEYADPNFPGARRAIDEYLGERAADLARDPFLDARYFVKRAE